MSRGGVYSPTTLDAAGSIDGARVLAKLLVLGLFAAIFALVWTPWQQSVTGSGRVIAYAPVERQQPIQATVSGRVTNWHVQEGDHVEAGDPIVDLSDLDPDLMDRLERQRRSVQAQLDAATLSVAVTESKINSLESVRSAAVLGVGLEQQIARDKRTEASEKVDGAQAKYNTAKLNLSRQKRLHDKGLASTRQLELAQLAMDTADAELEQAKASLAAAKRYVKAVGADIDKTDADTESKVQDAQESLQKARAEKSKAEQELAKIDVQLARQRNMRITAPRAGAIFRLVARQGGEVVKAGDTLAILVPDTQDRAVELWVDGNDAPLITPGRHVRLQFEGWPAVQFVGWPSVAVGTFGGEVAFVDATDNGEGKFRIVVVPDGIDEWPEGRYLRQGVRANGWVLLNQVSLGYELWRQFNGFPPAVQAPQTQPTAPHVVYPEKKK